MRPIAHMAGIDFAHHGIGFRHHAEHADDHDPDRDAEQGRIDGQDDEDGADVQGEVVRGWVVGDARLASVHAVSLSAVHGE